MSNAASTTQSGGTFVVESIGRWTVEKFRPLRRSDGSLELSTMFTGDRLGALMASTPTGVTLAVRSDRRPTITGLYEVKGIDVADEQAGANADDPSPIVAKWNLRRLTSHVHRTQAAVIERPSAITWPDTFDPYHASIGVPGTEIRSTGFPLGLGAANSDNGIITTGPTRNAGSIEWVCDPHRYYEGAASLWAVVPGTTPNAAATQNDPSRIHAPGQYVPTDGDVVVGNHIIEIWMRRDSWDMKFRRWTGPTIGGSWSDWRTIVVWDASSDVRGWTVGSNTPDRVAVTAERVAGLAKGNRITCAVHRGARHIEMTIEGFTYSVLLDAAKSTQRSTGGVAWAMKAGTAWIMTDADGGLNDSLSTDPLWVYADGIHAATARYGLTIDEGPTIGDEGVDEWPLWASAATEPLWGDR